MAVMRQAEGIRSVIINCLLPGDTVYPLRLIGVLYVPSLNHSLFSWNPLHSKGYRWEAIDGHVYLYTRNTALVLMAGFHGGLPYIIEATHHALVSFPPWTFKGRHPYEASWWRQKGWALCKAQSINIRPPKAWYESLTTFLILLGFTVAVFFYPYVLLPSKHQLFVAIYVDDITLFGPPGIHRDALTDLGALSWLLGIQI